MKSFVSKGRAHRISNGCLNWILHFIRIIRGQLLIQSCVMPKNVSQPIFLGFFVSYFQIEIVGVFNTGNWILKISFLKIMLRNLVLPTLPPCIFLVVLHYIFESLTMIFHRHGLSFPHFFKMSFIGDAAHILYDIAVQ